MSSPSSDAHSAEGQSHRSRGYRGYRGYRGRGSTSRGAHSSSSGTFRNQNTDNELAHPGPKVLRDSTNAARHHGHCNAPYRGNSWHKWSQDNQKPVLTDSRNQDKRSVDAPIRRQQQRGQLKPADQQAQQAQLKLLGDLHQYGLDIAKQQKKLQQSTRSDPQSLQLEVARQRELLEQEEEVHRQRIEAFQQHQEALQQQSFGLARSRASIDEPSNSRSTKTYEQHLSRSSGHARPLQASDSDSEPDQTQPRRSAHGASPRPSTSYFSRARYQEESGRSSCHARSPEASNSKEDQGRLRPSAHTGHLQPSSLLPSIHRPIRVDTPRLLSRAESPASEPDQSRGRQSARIGSSSSSNSLPSPHRGRKDEPPRNHRTNVPPIATVKSEDHRASPRPSLTGPSFLKTQYSTSPIRSSNDATKAAEHRKSQDLNGTMNGHVFGSMAPKAPGSGSAGTPFSSQAFGGHFDANLAKINMPSTGSAVFGGASNAVLGAPGQTAASNPFMPGIGNASAIGSAPAFAGFGAAKSNPFSATTAAANPFQASNTPSAAFGTPSNHTAISFSQPGSANGNDSSQGMGTANSNALRPASKFGSPNTNLTNESSPTFGSDPAKAFIPPTQQPLSFSGAKTSTFGASKTLQQAGGGVSKPSPAATIPRNGMQSYQQQMPKQKEVSKAGPFSSASIPVPRNVSGTAGPPTSVFASSVALAQAIEERLKEKKIFSPRRSTKSPGDPSQKTAVFEYWQALKRHRKLVLDSLVAAKLLDDPLKSVSLSGAIDFKGTCEDMCPEEEMIRRIVENDVNVQEKEPGPDGSMWPSASKIIKENARSAAGENAKLPSDVRSPAALRRTLDYIIHEFLQDEQKLPSHHNFIWDRTRAIRRDFVFQPSLSSTEAADLVYCLETITRFHVTALHLMSVPETAAKTASFVEQQEIEQLSKALLSLIHAYEDCALQGIKCENECEFRAYYVLLNSRNPAILEIVQDWGWKFWGESEQIKVAVSMVEAMQNIWDYRGPLEPQGTTDVAQNSFSRFFTILKSCQVSYTMACFAEMSFNSVRQAVLTTIMSSYKRGRETTKDWTLENLNAYMQFDDEHEILAFGEAYGVRFEEADDDFYLVVLPNINVEEPFPAPKQAHSVNLVERKRGTFALMDVITSTVYPDKDAVGEQNESKKSAGAKNTQDSEEELFVKDSQTPIPSPAQTPSIFAAPLASSGASQAPTVSTFNWGKSEASPVAKAALQFPQPSATLAHTQQPSAQPVVFNFSTINNSANPHQSVTQPIENPFPAFGSFGTAGGNIERRQPAVDTAEHLLPVQPVVAAAVTQSSLPPAIFPNFTLGQTNNTQLQRPLTEPVEVVKPTCLGDRITQSFQTPVAPFQVANTPEAAPSQQPLTQPPFSKLPLYQTPPPPAPPSQASPSQATSAQVSSAALAPSFPISSAPAPAVQTPSPPCTAQPHALEGLSKWYALGRHGLMSDFTENCVEDILTDVFRQFQQEEARRIAEEKAEKVRKKAEAARQEADDFRRSVVEVKYFNMWREFAFRRWTMRQGRAARQARIEYSESMRAAKEAQSANMVEDFRASTKARHKAQKSQPRRPSLESLLDNTGALDGVHDRNESLKTIMGGMQSRHANKRHTLSRASTASASSTTKRDDPLRRSILSDPSYLQGGSRLELLPGNSTVRSRVSGVQTDYFRLKARGIYTLPDGSPLASSVAKTMYHGKRTSAGSTKAKALASPSTQQQQSTSRSVPARFSATVRPEANEEIQALKAKARAIMAEEKSKGSRKHVLDSEDADLFERAKRVREQMDESSDWLGKEFERLTGSRSMS